VVGSGEEDGEGAGVEGLGDGVPVDGEGVGATTVPPPLLPPPPPQPVTRRARAMADTVDRV
jgi:hypothetical protein